VARGKSPGASIRRADTGCGNVPGASRCRPSQFSTSTSQAEGCSWRANAIGSESESQCGCDGKRHDSIGQGHVSIALQMARGHQNMAPARCWQATIGSMRKPAVFIGSSVEHLDLAHALQENLERFAEPTVWDQGIFTPSRTAMESLVDVLETTDFAVFVFAPADILIIRDQEERHSRQRDFRGRPLHRKTESRPYISRGAARRRRPSISD